MSDYLFDTTVFIDWWRGVPGAISLFNAVIEGRRTASFSAITTLELFQFENMGRQEEVEFIALCLLLEEASVSSEISGIAGRMLRGLSRNMRRLTVDSLIAATAMSRGEKIYSRNQRDLLRFYSEVESY